MNRKNGWGPVQPDAEGEKGSEEGLVKLPKINGSPRGWEPYLLQVLHSLIFFFLSSFGFKFFLSQLKSINQSLFIQSFQWTPRPSSTSTSSMPPSPGASFYAPSSLPAQSPSSLSTARSRSSISLPSLPTWTAFPVSTASLSAPRPICSEPASGSLPIARKTPT